MKNETELRGKIDRPEVFTEKLYQLGFKQGRRGKMIDYIYDHHKLDLKAQGQKVRIRFFPDEKTGMVSGGVLCWKGKRFLIDRVKSRKEAEARIDNVPKTIDFLILLGFTKIKEIKRQYFNFIKSGVVVRLETFDFTPILHLAEIEGDVIKIKELVKTLKMEDVFGPFTLNSFLKKYS